MDQFESDLIKNTHEDHKNLCQPIVIDKYMLTNLLSPLKIIFRLKPNPYLTRNQPQRNLSNSNRSKTSWRSD